MKVLALFLTLLALAGCMGDPTFDASSDEAIKASAEKIASSLPEERREEFQKAFMYFTMGGSDAMSNLFGAALAGETATEAMFATNLSSMDGFTGEQIIDKHHAARDADEQAAVARKRVRELQQEAEALLEDKQFEDAIAAYEKMSMIPSGVEAAETGIADATNEMRAFAQKMSYVDKIEITDFSAKRIDTYSGKGRPASRISLKNLGDRSLDRVEITVYFYDDQGAVIYEENYLPVLVSQYSFGRDNKPLKAGYVKEMEADKWYALDVPLSDWQEGSAKAKVTDLEFSE